MLLMLVFDLNLILLVLFLLLRARLDPVRKVLHISINHLLAVTPFKQQRLLFLLILLALLPILYDLVIVE